VISNIKVVSFDLDGTIYFGDELAKGAIDLINFLDYKGIKVYYFTNNSTKSRAQLHEKLNGMGLSVSNSQIYSSAHATAVYVKQQGIRSVFCVGAQGLIDELKLLNISLSEDKAEIIVVGLDPYFDYKTMAKVLNKFTKDKCPIIACNKDGNYPIENNLLMPGCGAIVSAIEHACGKTVDIVIGKPNTYMIELLSTDCNINNNEIMVVGDSYASDIEMAKRYNCLSVLIANNPDPNVTDTIVVKELCEIKDIFANDYKSYPQIGRFC
jgi:HAD superfamily hydrolase (TIGR01450 family)